METGTVDLLAPSVVAHLLSLVDAPGVHAVAIFGSVARGDTHPWSDIDLHVYSEPAAQKRDSRAAFIGDRLVMIEIEAVDDLRAELRTPARAVWAVPAILDMRILLDREGRLAALKLEAEAFDWSSLRAEAEASECRRLVASAEYVYKIRGALLRQDESATLHAAGALMRRCTRAVVTARGVLIHTENEYYRKAREAAGPEWAECHRGCFGLTGHGPVALDAFAQGLAACRLYAATVKALDDILDPPARDVATRAIALLR